MTETSNYMCMYKRVFLRQRWNVFLCAYTAQRDEVLKVALRLSL